jgi:hypothetical protein
VSAVAFALFVVVERLVREPLMAFGLFRHLNSATANLSQIFAGIAELGVGFLLPLYLLRILAMDPGTAGLGLGIATMPIIVVAPLAGRVFDRVGWPDTARRRLPRPGAGLLLAGRGLILTVNDPVGMNAVPAEERGEAAGLINTSEQLGGANGVAGLTAILFTSYFGAFTPSSSRVAGGLIAARPADGLDSRGGVQSSLTLGLGRAARGAGTDASAAAGGRARLGSAGPSGAGGDLGVPRLKSPAND